MAQPRLVKSLAQLRTQINAMFPKRSKASDGWIGDTRHSHTKSDHNPEKDGTVDAVDITHDVANGLDIAKFVTAMIAAKPKQIAYMIANGQIISGNAGPSPWVRRTYKGKNKHTKHVHVSVLDKFQDDTTPWDLSGLGGKAPAKPKPEPKETNINNMSLTIGNRGPHVITLQQQLTTLGYWDAPNNGIFDKKLETAVKAFQTDHKDKDGQPLLVDGKAGNRTSAAIGAALEAKESKPKMAAAKKVVNDAASEGKVISRTEKAALLGGLGSVGSVAAAVEDGRNAVDSAASIWETALNIGPWVIAFVALGACAYIFWDRRNKRLDARQAQEVMEE